MKKLVVWALFDSGNGSYYQVAKNYENIELYSIGIDRENKNDHFINLDLSDYSYIFMGGGSKSSGLYITLDKLPKPDLIIASPPCESWSNASAMVNGNACWKKDTIENLFGTAEGSTFTVREHKEYDNYQFIPENQIPTRINGELCIFNTIQIIKKYKPQYYVIENPAYCRIWEYIKKILGFTIEYENITYYSNYGFEVKKPTKFGSNINYQLDRSNNIKLTKTIQDVGSYNERSNIPHEIIKKIFDTIIDEINK